MKKLEDVVRADPRINGMAEGSFTMRRILLTTLPPSMAPRKTLNTPCKHYERYSECSDRCKLQMMQQNVGSSLCLAKGA